MNLQNYKLNFEELNTAEAAYLAKALGVKASTGLEVFEAAVASELDQASVVLKVIGASDTVGMSVIERLTGIKRHTWHVAPKAVEEAEAK